MDKISLMRRVLRGEFTHEETEMERINKVKYRFLGEYVPGTLNKPSEKGSVFWDTVYVENKKEYSSLFLFKLIFSEMEKEQENDLGGMISGECRLYTPDERVYSDISIRSNVNFSRETFFNAVQAIGSSTAHIERADSILESIFKIDDGSNFNLVDCGISFPGGRKGRNKV